MTLDMYFYLMNNRHIIIIVNWVPMLLKDLEKNTDCL